jgi:hypothetical protein
MEHTNSPEYLAAIAAHDAALADFARVRDAYRASRVGDAVFIKALAAKKLADAAFGAEAARS